ADHRVGRLVHPGRALGQRRIEPGPGLPAQQRPQRLGHLGPVPLPCHPPTITVPRARTPALRARHPAVPLLPAARRYLRHSTASSSPAPTLSGPGPTFAFPPHLGPAPPPAAPRASPRLPAYPGPRCHGDVEVGLHRGEV